MSQENVEVARRALEAVFRRPKPDFATINALFHSEHEHVSGIGRVEGGLSVGAKGFRNVLDNMSEAWESWEAHIEQARSIDDDRVLLAVAFRGRSRLAGVPVEQQAAEVMTVRAGKVVRTENYSSPEEALKAVGLAE
jgi:ketosteroid isomerase-like protein